MRVCCGWQREEVARWVGTSIFRGMNIQGIKLKLQSKGEGVVHRQTLVLWLFLETQVHQVDQEYC